MRPKQCQSALVYCRNSSCNLQGRTSTPLSALAPPFLSLLLNIIIIILNNPKTLLRRLHSFVLETSLQYSLLLRDCPHLLALPSSLSSCPPSLSMNPSCPWRPLHTPLSLLVGLSLSGGDLARYIDLVFDLMCVLAPPLSSILIPKVSL